MNIVNRVKKKSTKKINFLFVYDLMYEMFVLYYLSMP